MEVKREYWDKVTHEWKAWRIPTRTQCEAIFNYSGRCPICNGDTWNRGEWNQQRFTEGGVEEVLSHLDCPHPIVCGILHQMRLHVAPHDRHMTRLEPSPLANCDPAWQQKVIEVVKAHPKESFIFYGPAGVGKTSLSTWLYIQALTRYFNRKAGVRFEKPDVYRVSVQELLTQEREWRTRSLDEEARDIRTLTTALIASESSIFLEEVDKFGRMTDMKAEVMFALFNEIYKQNAQVVMDTNLTMAGFEDYMEGGENYSGTMVRRITAMCWKVDYWRQEITPPREQKR
jgi:hypothetical protein